MNLTVKNLNLDEALVTFYNERTNPVIIKSRLGECNNCSYTFNARLLDKANYSIKYTSRYSTQLLVEDAIDPSSFKCSCIYSFTEHSTYNFTIKSSDDCEIKPVYEAPSNLIPILIALGIYITVIALSLFFGFLWNIWKNNHSNVRPTGNNDDVTSSLRRSGQHRYQSSGSQVREYDPNEPLSDSNPISSSDIIVDVHAQARRRIRSLDALRGLTILLMIFVNYGGGGYIFFEHAAWYGLTIADVVFPSFVFIMGFSIVLSVKSQLTLKKDFVLVMLNIIKRSFKLFIIGFILNAHNADMTTVRITGVLQRFAISYLVIALFHLISVYRSNKYQHSNEHLPWAQLVLIFLPEVLVNLSMLLIYFVCTFGVHYTTVDKFGSTVQCPEGYFGPGGLENYNSTYYCTGGIANYIDEIIFGSKRMYQTPTSQEIYHHPKPHDPEGALGYTTSIILTEIGLICGRVILKVGPHHKRILIWFIIALICGLSALALSPVIPIVKNLWTLSYVFTNAAITLVTFILMYFFIDVLRAWPSGIPFNYPGTNAILLYIGHLVLGNYFPFYYIVDDTSHSWLLFRTLAATNLWLLISAYFYYKKWFVTL